MIFNLKDMDMNNYISWVYSTLLQRVQNDEANIKTNRENIKSNLEDITLLFGYVGVDGQSSYQLGIPLEQIPEDSNLNDYTITGTYYCTGTSVATTIENCPTTYNFKLVVEIITAAFTQQTVIDRAGRRWYRTYAVNADTWTDWICGSMLNIRDITMNANGELVVTRADGVTATFAPTSLL